MKNLRSRWLIITTSVIFFSLIAISFNSAARESEAVPLLFLPTEKTGTLDWSDDPTITHYRYTAINFDLLEQLEVGAAIGLNVFDGTTFTAVLEQKIAITGDGFALLGHIEGIPLSGVAIVSRGNQLAADISMPGGIHQVRYAGNDVHAVLQVDQSAFPDEAPPIPVSLPQDNNDGDLPATPQDDGSTIDALVVYTPAARDAEGGTTAIQNLINLAVVEANQSYENSGINQRLNLVHMMEVNYTESGDTITDLDRLKTASDGYMDNVPQARDTYAADVVTLIEEITDLCGRGYMMTTVSASFESYAFSIVARNCATGYYSYAHELGHNMSAHHDWYVEDSLNNPYSYNKGYLNVQAEWRTIMAYNSECSDSGVSCQRLQYWSNPDVLYNGDPMGVPIGISTECIAGDLFHPDCDADNRQTLNNTALTVSNFRASSSDVGPLEYSSHLVDDDTSGDSTGDDDGIVECGETIELFVDLINLGSDTATSVNASLSMDDAYVTFLYNMSSSYPNIAGGGTGWNSDDYDILVASNTPNGHVINFDLDISASNGGPWTDSFPVTVSCSGNNPPYTPSNPSPPDSAIDVSSITDLGWIGGDPDGDPVTYDVYFEANDNTPDQLLCNDVSSTSCDPGMLGYETNYYWRVVAFDGQATTDGPVWSFTTAEEPGEVTVASVWTADLSANPKDTFEAGEGIRYYLAADNTTGSTATAYFEWHVSGPCGSVLDWTGDLETDAGTTDWYFETTTPTDCPGSHTFEGSLTYNSVKTSDSTSFTVNPTGTPPGAFTKSSPPDGTTGVSTNPTLSWGTSSDADNFEYCYDTSDDDDCSSWLSNGTSTSVGLSGLSNGTTYFWHVRAINGFGTTYANGSATAFWSFTTGSALYRVYLPMIIFR